MKQFKTVLKYMNLTVKLKKFIELSHGVYPYSQMPGTCNLFISHIILLYLIEFATQIYQHFCLLPNKINMSWLQVKSKG